MEIHTAEDPPVDRRPAPVGTREPKTPPAPALLEKQQEIKVSNAKMAEYAVTFRNASGFHRSANLSVYLAGDATSLQCDLVIPCVAEPPSSDGCMEQSSWKVGVAMDSKYSKAFFTSVICMNVTIYDFCSQKS